MVGGIYLTMFNYYLMRFVIAGNAGSTVGNWYGNADKKVAYETAMKQYYNLVATAANSSNPVDTIILFDYNGVPIKMQRFNHE